MIFRLFLITFILCHLNDIGAQEQLKSNSIELGVGYNRSDRIPHLQLEMQNQKKSSWLLRLNLNSKRYADEIIGEEPVFLERLDSVVFVPKYNYKYDNYLKFALGRRLYLSKKDYSSVRFYFDAALSTFLYLNEKPDRFERLSFPLTLDVGMGLKMPLGDKLSCALEMQFEQSLINVTYQESAILKVKGLINIRLAYRFESRDSVSIQ